MALFKDKEKDLFLAYLKEILKNDSLSKEIIFKQKKEVYLEDKNKKWANKMDTLVKVIVTEGKKLEEALFQAGIITKNEQEYLALAKSDIAGIEYILEKKEDRGVLKSVFINVWFIPFLIILANIPAARAWHELNLNLKRQIDPVLKTTNRGELSVPELFADPTFFYYSGAAYIGALLLFFVFYKFIYREFPLFFVSLFRFRAFEIQLSIYDKLITNKELGLTDSKSAELLQKNSSCLIEKSVYKEFHQSLIEGTKDTLKKILIKHGLDRESANLTGFGEQIKGKFLYFLKQSRSILILKYDNKIKGLKIFSKALYHIQFLGWILGPLIIEMEFIMIQIMDKL